jgi:hypothetical protein
MSRARSNFITSRNGLPKDILNGNQIKNEEIKESSSKNKDKGPANILFFKKPKFIGNKKEFLKKNLEDEVKNINKFRQI